jgi:hypothetical protein
MELIDDGRVLDRPGGQQIGYIKDDVVYSGGSWTSGGNQVGYIKDDIVYAGGSWTSGGRQVGYLNGDAIYSGGNWTSGGSRVGPAKYPHPRWNAAVFFLLT